MRCSRSALWHQPTPSEKRQRTDGGKEVDDNSPDVKKRSTARGNVGTQQYHRFLPFFPGPGSKCCPRDLAPVFAIKGIQKHREK
jgi:hypothetical protein